MSDRLWPPKRNWWHEKGPSTTSCHSGLVSRSEDDSGPRLAAARLAGKKCKASAKKRPKAYKHTQEAINPNKF